MTDTIEQSTTNLAGDQSAAAHYDDDYFSWQREIGKFAGEATRVNFAPRIRANHKVLDFGCGGGYLLAGLECQARIGVEINPVARVEAERNGVQVVASTEDVPDGWADVVISN